jgi:hypothetical protein
VRLPLVASANIRNAALLRRCFGAGLFWRDHDSGITRVSRSPGVTIIGA